MSVCAYDCVWVCGCWRVFLRQCTPTRHAPNDIAGNLFFSPFSSAFAPAPAPLALVQPPPPPLLHFAGPLSLSVLLFCVSHKFRIGNVGGGGGVGRRGRFIDANDENTIERPRSRAEQPTAADAQWDSVASVAAVSSFSSPNQIKFKSHHFRSNDSAIKANFYDDPPNFRGLSKMHTAHGAPIATPYTHH